MNKLVNRKACFLFLVAVAAAVSCADAQVPGAARHNVKTPGFYPRASSRPAHAHRPAPIQSGMKHFGPNRSTDFKPAAPSRPGMDSRGRVQKPGVPQPRRPRR